MRKFFAFFLGFVMSLALLTGCGKSTATPTTDYHGEGEIQGGIKSDEDIAAITQEAEQNTEQPSYEDNTGHEPDAYGTGNFQDYWEGEDYFDIVGFATANGCTQVSYYRSDWSSTDNESDANYYKFYFGRNWMVQPLGTGCILTYLGNTNSDGSNAMSPEYTITANSPDEIGNASKVSIRHNNNATLNSWNIDIFNTVITAIAINQDSLDPLSDTNLNYSQTR